MQTYTGRAVWPIDPRVEDVDINDIAHALSRQCRYNGHCIPETYSVAEHSYLISTLVPDEYKLWALLHDASEAYITDIPRPLKPFLSNYKEYEAAWMQVICERYDLPLEMPEIVHQYDNLILAVERDQIMTAPPIDWGLTATIPGLVLPCWNPDEAEFYFLMQFHRLYKGD